MIFQCAAVKGFYHSAELVAGVYQTANLKEPHFFSTAQKCYKLLFKRLHVNISFCSLLFLHSCPLVCLPHVRAGIPTVVCGELLGDYHSLGAAELVWAQAGVARQTVVAGVSLPGLKD